VPIIVVLAATAVVAAFPLLWWAVASTDPRSTVDRSVLAGGFGPTDLRTAALQRSAGERAVKPAAHWLARTARRFTPYAWVEALDHRLKLAGRPPAWPLERLLVAKIVLGAVMFLLGLQFFSVKQTVLWLLIWVGITALGYFAPDLLLHSQAEKRREMIAKALPDTLDQMTVSVEAGMGFEAAMARAGKTGRGPLAEELVRTLQEVQVGVPRTTALRNLAERTEQPDLRHFVLAVVQAESYGIPIANVLRTQAGEQRLKRRQRAEERAMRIPVKIIFPLIICIMPTIFIVVLGPAAIQIVRMFSER
jgi:tight adherence protein C